jgi:hypothetical protein
VSAVALRVLLAAAGGAGGVALPPDTATWTVTAADDGGWNHQAAAKAIEHDGVVYFGYVDMASGNLELRAFDPAAGTTSSAVVIAAAFEADTHAAPAIWIRPDGRLLVAYSRHVGADMYRRITTNPLPDLTLGPELALDATLGGTGYTYPILVPFGSDLWLFYRDHQDAGLTAALAYSVSADDGATWSAQTTLYRSLDRSSYWAVSSDGSRIDVATSDGREPFDAAPITIGHMYYDGTWRQSDGTAIAGGIPFDPADLTTVYDAADGMGWPSDIVTDGDRPAFTYAVLDTIGSNSWRRARWNGSAWVNSAVADSDGVIDGNFADAIILDHLNPDRVYAPIYDGSHWSMHRFATSDGGSTWTDTLVAGGAVDHLTPAPVFGSTGRVRAMWMTGGPYTGYLDGGFGLTAGR